LPHNYYGDGDPYAQPADEQGTPTPLFSGKTVRL
jgi:hypothetical protein